ncbi:hypothetical protein YC2023_084582 [Brassica napus]
MFELGLEQMEIPHQLSKAPPQLSIASTLKYVMTVVVRQPLSSLSSTETGWWTSAIECSQRRSSHNNTTVFPRHSWTPMQLQVKLTDFNFKLTRNIVRVFCIMMIPFKRVPPTLQTNDAIARLQDPRSSALLECIENFVGRTFTFQLKLSRFNFSSKQQSSFMILTSAQPNQILRTKSLH